ncbi:hypothetical protein ACNUDM_18630 [Vibrio chaetopteri]|uniref:hypothetical protein n=1 Tax=Vibrio chaetopteri TaxID=3016528 RepID=UPI003AB324A5
MIKPDNILGPIFDKYLNNELPDNFDGTDEQFHPPVSELDFDTEQPDLETVIARQLENVKYSQESFKFSSALAMLGIYTPISKEGVRLIKSIAKGHQIVDPPTGRGFNAIPVQLEGAGSGN